MKKIKQVTAGVFVAVLAIAGLMITPLDVNAAEVVQGEHGVEYVLDTENYNFTKFWKADATQRTAPTREGCVFGGWYKKETVEDKDKFVAITESEAEEIKDASNVWAKFVPAEVLSIRAQLQKETEDGTANRGTSDNSYLRLLSGVNGLDYQKVGFDILYNKKTKDTEANIKTATNITKVFSKITNEETGESGMVASELFGDAATHFSVLRLNKILSKNYKLVIYVTPQWTTLDGTLVEGQAKYLRIIDGFTENRYISVPVNFMSGSKVAAGQIDISYDSNTLELVQMDDLATAGFDAGTLLTEMNYYDNGAGTIKIVGNIDKAPTDNTQGVEPETNIYANVWFKVKNGADLSGVTNWTFEIKNLSFCDWEETMITDISAWDFKYIK